MLSAIVAAIGDAGKPLCLSDLSATLHIEESALEGMLETLVQRGRLRAIEFEDDGCTTCPLKGGCFIINDGVAVTYALPADPTGPKSALPAFSSRPRTQA